MGSNLTPPKLLTSDHDLDDLERYVDIINAELEFIRQSNDELRIASVYWYRKANKKPTK